MKINLYKKEHQVCAMAQCKGISGAAVTDRFPEMEYTEVVDEALEEFCLNWIEEYKHSNIMSAIWVVAEEEPNEYVAISL